ncbi:MAG: hypothetical protein ABIO94_00915 [Opitutaceae bacterium]
MSALRWGSFLVSSGLMILPRLFGADAPAAADVSKSRAGSENVSVENFTISRRPIVDGARSAQAKSSSSVRTTILEAFPYNPSARAEPRPEHTSPILLRSQPAPVDPEVVVMANFEVSARAYERGLPEAIANWRDPRPRNDAKFGTGTHQKDFGKVRASMVTILYVPIFFGLSW